MAVNSGPILFALSSQLKINPKKNTKVEMHRIIQVINKSIRTGWSRSDPISHNFHKAQMRQEMPRSSKRNPDHAEKPKELISLNIFNQYE